MAAMDEHGNTYRQGVSGQFIRIADDASAEALREAITNLARTASKCPAYLERKAKMHDRINALLTELDGKGDGRGEVQHR